MTIANRLRDAWTAFTRSDVTIQAERTTPENILAADVRAMEAALSMDRLHRIANDLNAIWLRHLNDSSGEVLQRAAIATAGMRGSLDQVEMYLEMGEQGTADIHLSSARSRAIASLRWLSVWEHEFCGARWYQGPPPGIMRGDDNE